MTSEPIRYLNGYSLGAGGIVLCEERVLLVRLGYGSARELWSLPGGYVEPDETADRTAVREVLEETGVAADVEGLVAVRSRVLPHENSTYLVFLLRAASQQTRPDGVEALDARFFTRAEVDALPNLTPMTRLLVERVFAGDARALQSTTVPPYPENEFVLFV